MLAKFLNILSVLLETASFFLVTVELYGNQRMLSLEQTFSLELKRLPQKAKEQSRYFKALKEKIRSDINRKRKIVARLGFALVAFFVLCVLILFLSMSFIDKSLFTILGYIAITVCIIWGIFALTIYVVLHMYDRTIKALAITQRYALQFGQHAAGRLRLFLDKRTMKGAFLLLGGTMYIASKTLQIGLVAFE